MQQKLPLFIIKTKWLFGFYIDYVTIINFQAQRMWQFNKHYDSHKNTLMEPRCNHINRLQLRTSGHSWKCLSPIIIVRLIQVCQLRLYPTYYSHERGVNSFRNYRVYRKDRSRYQTSIFLKRQNKNGKRHLIEWPPVLKSG